MRSTARFLFTAFVATFIACFLVPTGIPTACAQSVADFDIPAQPLVESLKAVANQTGTNVLFDRKIVSGLKAPALKARLTPEAAVAKLLEGTGVRHQVLNEHTIVLKLPKTVTGRSAAVDDPVRLAQAAGVTMQAANPTLQDADSTQGAREDRESNDAHEQDQIIVTAPTGTRIRGGSAPSPVITIGSQRIREEGFSDLGEVLRSIPQNFSGGQNPGIAAGATGGGNDNRNITGGSGLNLRGLGQDASLTLLNGRRMSYSSFVQMVDISAIPVEAVDRIEIVADGASAIYGSDAVGGVGNVILKRDFKGVMIGARYGNANDGGLTTREYTATGGTSWSTGGLIATWKKSSNDPIYADQRDYTRHMYSPSTLYQRNDLSSGLLSAHQLLGERAELRLDTLWSKREILTDLAYAATYERTIPETTTSLISPSIEFLLPKDWTLSAGAAWGKDDSDGNYRVVTIATGASTFSRPSYSNESRTYEVSAEGPLFTMSGGKARLAVGAGQRDNEYLSRNLVSGVISAEGDMSSRFAYAEINLPVVGADQAIPGVQRFALTGAMRSEDYDSFGGVTTPKFGLSYSPSADFTLKASWGKSFKTPTLSLLYLPQSAYLLPAAALGGTSYAAGSTVIYLAGGNPNLSPERAQTRNVSLALHPEALPSLEAELSWFKVDYTDRVAQPFVPNQALSNPNFAPFINSSPTVADLAAVAASYTLINASGAAYDPSRVVAIAPNLPINMSRQWVKGLDLSGSYRFDLAAGRLTVRGSSTWLDNRRQVAPTQSAYDLTGTLFYPAKISGRGGAVWNRDGVSLSVFGNYKSGVTNTADAKKAGSFTTFDTVLRYDAGERGDIWSGMGVEFSAQNLFNRAPPLFATTSLTFVPYDSTNYSAVGRYLSLAISKHW